MPATKARRVAVDDASFSVLDQSVKLQWGMDAVRLDLEHHTPEQSPAGLGMERVTGGSRTAVAWG